MSDVRGAGRPGRAPARSVEAPPPADPGPMRVVLTDGPGGGKTTAADLFRREVGEAVVIVPEAATLLFAGGLPRSSQPDVLRATQRAVYHLQRNLEDIQAALYPDRVLLCDRGTVDGGAYWPDGAEGYFADVGTSLDAELARYDAVIFFESAALGGSAIEGGNRYRVESNPEAAALDHRLRQLWGRHPRFTLVPHDPSFIRKLTVGLAVLQATLHARRP